MGELLTAWVLKTGDSGISTNFSTLEAGPKNKFLFTVEFAFNSMSGDKGAEDMELIRFALKGATRPSPQINYESVNYYGYRTDVRTKMTAGTVTITFYDDVLDLAHDIFKNYMEATSPITRRTADQSSSLMEFDSRSTDELANPYGVIAYMKVHHFYGANGKAKKTTYTYLNPKLQSSTFSDLDMSDSNASEVQLTFV